MGTLDKLQQTRNLRPPLILRSRNLHSIRPQPSPPALQWKTMSSQSQSPRSAVPAPQNPKSPPMIQLLDLAPAKSNFPPLGTPPALHSPSNSDSQYLLTDGLHTDTAFVLLATTAALYTRTVPLHPRIRPAAYSQPGLSLSLVCTRRTSQHSNPT